MLEVDRVPLTDLQHMDLDTGLHFDEVTFVIATDCGGRIVGERESLEFAYIQLNLTPPWGMMRSPSCTNTKAAITSKAARTNATLNIALNVLLNAALIAGPSEQSMYWQLLCQFVLVCAKLPRSLGFLEGRF